MFVVTRVLVAMLSGFAAFSALASEITIERSYDGREFELRIVGRIENGDEEKFRSAMLLGIGLGLEPGGVTIFSQGGLVPPALDIGRQIRTARMWTGGPVRNETLGKRATLCTGRVQDEHGKKVAGGYSEFMWSQHYRGAYRGPRGKVSEIYDDPRCICTSACFLIWASGVARAKAVIGVHRPYFDRSEYGKLNLQDAMAAYNAMAEKVKEYLKEMDVPDRIIKKMMRASSEEMVELDNRDLEDLDNAAGGEGYVELQIAKCGSIAEELKATEQYKPGQQCDRTCQARIEALHAKMKSLEACHEAIKQQEAPRKGTDAYLARYGDRVQPGKMAQ